LKLILFDIDGTLINSGGAGSESMQIAFQKVWGIQNGFKDIFMMGKTDPAILEEALKKHNLTWDESRINTFKKYYFTTLKKEIKKDRPGKRVCPGIIPLLQYLYTSKENFLSLLTGNYKKSAFIKLNYFNLGHFFKNGVFSDDTEKRNEMVPIIKRKIKKKRKIIFKNKDIFVVGDTPSDINCARINGVQSLAVATGVHTFEELKSHKPDYLFTDLSETDQVVQVLGGIIKKR